MQRKYEPCCVGPPKMNGSWWKFWLMWFTGGAFLIAQLVKNPPAVQETPVQWFRKTHWRIPTPVFLGFPCGSATHWRNELQTTSVLPWDSYEQYEKAKWYDTEQWTPQVGKNPICYWRRVEIYLRKEWRSWAKAKTTHSCVLWLVM